MQGTTAPCSPFVEMYTDIKAEIACRYCMFGVHFVCLCGVFVLYIFIYNCNWKLVGIGREEIG